MVADVVVGDAQGEAVGTPVEAEVVEAVQIDPEKLVGKLTVAELRQVLTETVGAKRARKSSGSSAKAEAPEGYTMSVADVMEATGLGSMAVRRQCREKGFGEEGAVKVGSRWCIKPEAAEKFIAGKAERAASRAAKKAAKAEAKKGEAVSVDDIVDSDLGLDELDLDGAEAVEIDADIE